MALASYKYYNLHQLIIFNTGTQCLDWGNGITLINKTTVKDITNYIDFKINEYTKRNFKDKSLQELY